MELLKYHVSVVHREKNNTPDTDSDGPACPKQRRNKQQVRGEPSSDGSVQRAQEQSKYQTRGKWDRRATEPRRGFL